MEPWNRFVEGDNLDVLAALEANGERFDLVYLDPPYNTGSPLTYADRRRHEAWVQMMRPRLEGVRGVMSERAAIYVSIDDNEAARLRLLMDEVFGEQGFLAQIVVNLNPKGRQLGNGFATNHEYVLVYAKDPSSCALQASTTEAVDPADFPLEADGRRYRHLPLRNTNKKFNPATAPTLHYPLWGCPETGLVATIPFEGAVEVMPVFGDGTPAVWRWSPPLVEARPGDLVCRTIAGRLGSRVDVFQRDWLDVAPSTGSGTVGPGSGTVRPGSGTAPTVPRRKKLRTIWTAEEIGSTDVAVAELKALIGPVFTTPKPTGLIRRILATMPSDVRVLDLFAGSGTTGHAVALANQADGGARTCLSVNWAEPVPAGSPAALAGHASVADITRARLRAVDAAVGGGLDEVSR